MIASVYVVGRVPSGPPCFARPIPLPPPLVQKMDEIALATLSDGTIVANMRNDHLNACKCRALSSSVDGGATWSVPVTFDPVLISPVCEASFVRIDDWLYFSNPATTTTRYDLTLRRAPANVTAATLPPKWLDGVVLVDGGDMWGGYSAIVPQPVAPGVGGLLYEAGAVVTSSVIGFVTFPLLF